MILSRTIFRHALVGICNALLTIFTILILVEFFSVSPHASNIIGYILGFILSFVLNKKFTFRSKGSYFTEITRFNLSFILAFLINYLAFSICMQRLDYRVSTAVGMIIFSIIFYVLNKKFVFSVRKDCS